MATLTENKTNNTNKNNVNKKHEGRNHEIGDRVFGFCNTSNGLLMEMMIFSTEPIQQIKHN
mgnify:CR=1 FL=1